MLEWIKAKKVRAGKFFGACLGYLWRLTGIPWCKQRARQFCLRRTWLIAAVIIGRFEAILLTGFVIWISVSVALHSNSKIEIATKVMVVLYQFMLLYDAFMKDYGTLRSERELAKED